MSGGRISSPSPARSRSCVSAATGAITHASRPHHPTVRRDPPSLHVTRLHAKHAWDVAPTHHCSNSERPRSGCLLRTISHLRTPARLGATAWPALHRMPCFAIFSSSEHFPHHMRPGRPSGGHALEPCLRKSGLLDIQHLASECMCSVSMTSDGSPVRAPQACDCLRRVTPTIADTHLSIVAHGPASTTPDQESDGLRKATEPAHVR